jgi:hypothetical protein
VEAADVRPRSARVGLAGVAAAAASVLDGLNDHDRAVAIEVLMRLMVKVIAPDVAAAEVAGDE